MYEENNNDDKFTITLEGVLDRNATKSNLKKELLSLKKENFFKQTGLSLKSSKDFLSLSVERLKSLKRLKNDNLQKPGSFKSNVFKSNPFKDYFNLDFKKNSLEGVLKDLDSFKDKNSLAFKHLPSLKNNIGSYFNLKTDNSEIDDLKTDKLDLNPKRQYSYFKTENIKNTFKQNFIRNSSKDQTNKAFKDFKLNSNFDKIERNPAKDNFQELLGFKKENNQFILENLVSFRNLFKDAILFDFLNNGFDDSKLFLKEFQNLKDKKIPQLSLENFILKDNQIESVNKMLKRQRSFETEFERNDFLKKLYVLKSSQNSNLNDFPFMVELAQKLKNEGYAKNDSKVFSLISDFLSSENNLEKFLTFKRPTTSSLNDQLKAEPEFLNSNKIINSVFEPKLDPLLEKTLELLQWAKSYDFTNSVLEPLKNTFSNFGNLLVQAFESLPLVEYMTNVIRDGGAFNSRGIDDDSRMP
ncbi:hypothetical protein [Borreliella turdi]|uniref:hypothetical protein n=1 Tax=Borreliella turdi TaxID=57863 RepID=UPI001244E566|nr:hypothetical protein [Borreliella turdi]